MAGGNRHRHLLAHLVQQALYRSRMCHAPLAVQAEVEQGELQLAHHRHAGLEIARRQHFVQQCFRQRLRRSRDGLK